MTGTSTAAPAIPGYLTGTWTIDPVHSEVSFVVRHLMVSKVRGRFANSSGRPASVTSPVSMTNAGFGVIALISATRFRIGSTLPDAVKCVSVI